MGWRGRVAYENIIVDRDEGVAIITLNRPKVLNALSRALVDELDDAMTELESDDDVRVLVFIGAGDRAFSSGADIHEMARQADEQKDDTPDPKRAEYIWHIATSKKPTIGAINGLAYGGGAVMASAFDIRVGCEKTSFRFLAASYGRINSTWSLPMQIGWPMAKELLLTARVVEAREAYQIGLLNHLVACDQILLKALELGKLISANDGWMIEGIKELMIRNVDQPWEQMLKNEQDAMAGPLKPTPIKEGFKEFLGRKGKS